MLNETLSFGFSFGWKSGNFVISKNDLMPSNWNHSDIDFLLGKASAAASLWYKTPEETVRSLFHDMPGAHSFTTLLIFTILYYFLACWTYGMFISSGLFVPSLLIGASWVIYNLHTDAEM